MSGPSRGGVFISYRREEYSGMAGRLHDQLEARFGDGQVFMDVDTIGLGVDFAEIIAEAVSTCEVLLVLIGPQWLTVTNEQGLRRLDDPYDIVRLEVAAGLQRHVRVIPILVEGATMPRRQELPEDLAELAYRNALSLRYESFGSDIQRLVATLERTLAGAEGADTAPPRGAVDDTHAAPAPPLRYKHSYELDSTRDELMETLRRRTSSEASIAKQPLSAGVRSDHSVSSILSVFLCHSSSDKPVVRSLRKRLLGDGITPWLDAVDILPGQDWENEIRKAIRNCHVVLVCLSRASMTKVGFIQKEIRQVLDVADEQPEDTIFIIPVRLEECEVPDRLSRWQWVDLFEEDGYARLMLALTARRNDLNRRRAASAAERPSSEGHPWTGDSKEAAIPIRGHSAVAKVTIELPRDGERVSHQVPMEGTVQDLPSGMQLWIVKEPRPGNYHPDGGPLGSTIRIDGNKWYGTAFVGNARRRADEGHSFTIHIVQISSEEARRFGAYLDKAAEAGWPGLSTLYGGMVLQTVRVIRYDG